MSKFKEGDHVELIEEGKEGGAFRDCTLGKVYKAFLTESGHLAIRDDAGDRVLINADSDSLRKVEVPAKAWNKGDTFTISKEGIATRFFMDCVADKEYTLFAVCDKGTWVRFYDDVGDIVRVSNEFIRYLIPTDSVRKAVETPDFKGYETIRDFETIIDYALASNDMELFNECTAELDRRGWLEEYANLPSLVPTP